MSCSSNKKKDRSGGGGCIPEFQTRPPPLANLQAQLFSLRNKYAADRLADELDTFITYSGAPKKEKRVPRKFIYLLHEEDGGEQVNNSSKTNKCILSKVDNLLR